MARTELKELKIQLDELLQKGFIRPSVTMGCPSVVCKEKGWNLTPMYWLQGVEHDHYQKQISFAVNR